MTSVKAKVIGPLSVDGVMAPNYVELDPRYYNVRALIAAGHVELSKTALDELDKAERELREATTPPEPGPATEPHTSADIGKAQPSA